MKKLHYNTSFAQSLTPAARIATANGSGVDLQGYEDAEIIWDVGVITDGTHTPTIQESDDDSTYADVAASDLIGTLAALVSSTPQKAGYRGSKRYIRAVTTVAGATTGGVYSAGVLRGSVRHAPVTQP